MIVYGLIAYIALVLLIIGYFVAKKVGDGGKTSQDNKYNDFNDDVPNENDPQKSKA